MDRRDFLAGVGTIGAVTAGGWASLDAGARSARAAGLAKAAGVPQATGAKRAPAPIPQGLSVGFLPGSPGLLEYAARGREFNYLATSMRWAEWHPSLSLPIYEDRVDVRIGAFQSAQVWTAPNLTRTIEVVAHFAFDVSPFFGPFNAWRYEGASAGKAAKRTSSLVFEAGMPDRVGLQVSYAFERENLAPGISDRGSVYLPLGARDGPGAGIYVLASPSRVTGARPDFTEYTFTGDLIQPMRRNTGGTPDFDFATLTIAPISNWS